MTEERRKYVLGFVGIAAVALTLFLVWKFVYFSFENEFSSEISGNYSKVETSEDYVEIVNQSNGFVLPPRVVSILKNDKSIVAIRKDIENLEPFYGPCFYTYINYVDEEELVDLRQSEIDDLIKHDSEFFRKFQLENKKKCKGKRVFDRSAL